ncbi:MAG: cation transporter [Firmicutes bacterium]|nr:cation transporter [Bacillota bacterium]
MTKIYLLENLGCANCSAKMERKISKLTGVEEASVNFFSGKLLIETLIEDETRILEIEKEVAKIIRKIEPNVIMKKVK